MIKVYCDICENEIIGQPNVSTLDFTKDCVHLCDSCASKFKEAKETIFSAYKTRFDDFKADYLEDLKTEILETNETDDVNPQPVFE